MSNGFDDLEKQLDKISKAAKDLEGTQSVDISLLLTSKFLRKHSRFSSFSELLEAGNFQVNSQEEFEAIPESDFDEHIRKTTDFSSWEKMLEAASEEYILEKIGF